MKFSASKSALLAICNYPYGASVDAPEVDPGPAARIGTSSWARVAAFMEHRPDPGNTPDLSPGEADDADAYYRAGLAWAQKRRRIASRCEIAMAWSPSRDVARELPRSAKLRDYSDAKGDEVCGSIDLIDWDMDQVLLVEDVKTGMTPLATYLPQVRTLGLFAARANGVRKVRVRLVKLHEDGSDPETLEETLGGFALDAIAFDLRNRLDTAEGATPVPGDHCTQLWCPARLVCPEVQSAVAELIPADQLTMKPRLTHEFISHDHDAAMLAFVRLVKKWAEDLNTVIKKRTPEGGVMLSDGRFLREGSHNETRWRQDAVLAKARELGAKAGLMDEQIDQELETCRVTFRKSEGLRVVKALKAAS